MRFVEGWGIWCGIFARRALADEVGDGGDEGESDDVGEDIQPVAASEEEAWYKEIEVDIEGGEDQRIDNDVPLCGWVAQV